MIIWIFLINLFKILTNCDEKAPVTYKAIILLNFMPDSYMEVKNIIQYGRNTWEIVIDFFRSKEMEIIVERDDKRVMRYI